MFSCFCGYSKCFFQLFKHNTLATMSYLLSRPWERVRIHSSYYERDPTPEEEAFLKTVGIHEQKRLDVVDSMNTYMTRRTKKPRSQVAESTTAQHETAPKAAAAQVEALRKAAVAQVDAAPKAAEAAGGRRLYKL